VVQRHPWRCSLSKRGGGRGRRRRREEASKPEAFLVFGENEHDTKSLKALIEDLCPAAKGKVHTRRQPLVLIKGRKRQDALDQAERIVGVVNAENVRRDVQCVFLHEDCDAIEPAHEAYCEQIENALRERDCPCEPHAVVPAWDIEAWWFLWPDVLPQVNGNWTAPTAFKGKSVGNIKRSKERLRRELRKGQGKSKGKKASKNDYREEDSIAIAQKIAELGLADSPQGRSASYDRFRASVKACCKRLANSSD